MPVLTIRHLPQSDPPQFQVVHADGRAAGPFAIEPPSQRHVEGRPTTDLPFELRWYLEEFLEYPFPPETEHAERVRSELRKWGRDAFDALFSGRQTGKWFEDGIEGGLENLVLRVTSDAPAVLAWPWEALEDAASGPLAQTCRVERRLDRLPSLVELPDLPRDRVNVLLVVARPYAADVRFGSIARPLVELVEERRLPVSVTLLRPPTFERLEKHLRERPGHYHLVHFDGHGGYGKRPSGSGALPAADSHRYDARGLLAFEKDDGSEDAVGAGTLGTLLREHRIPAVVLNACRSAMVDARAADPFASVATALLQAGIRHVVAMSHSLYVSAAQEFLPAFYDRLFATGRFDEAVREGRRRLRKEPGRVCSRGRFPLEDWLVPVAYAQGTEELSFAATGTRTEAAALPAEMETQASHYGLIGRDGALLRLERALRRPPGVLLVTGLGGVGKTTLAWGFAQWLLRTGGLRPEELFWFRFDEIGSAEYVLNRIGERFFGDQSATLDAETKLKAILEALRERRCLMVWDNFESVHGIAGTSVGAKLPEEDQDLLRRLARGLYGGATKILLTSRSAEEWLEKRHRFPLALGGLVGEERWELCERIVRDQGLQIDRKDATFKDLLEMLGGHPLAMRVVLPELERHTAQALRERLAADVGSFAGAGLDDAERKLFATLRFATEQLPEDLRPLLVPLALHERFVDADYLERMAQQVDASRWPRERIDACLRALTGAGLVQDRGQSIYELHPLLTRYLQVQVPADEAWTRAFVGFFGRFADRLAPEPLHQQRPQFHVHGENLHTARREAERLGMEEHYGVLTQCLAAYAQNQRNNIAAQRLFEDLAAWCALRGREDLAASPYHHLGMIAEERRAFDEAERWYRKSLEINERLGDERGAASTYHQFGRIAQARRAFDEAERWYHRSLEIKERLGDDHGASLTYHQLGMTAEERRAFDDAEPWYRKAIQVFQKLGFDHRAASTYHQLGNIALARRAFDDAERWYRKALEIKERLGDEHGAAHTYHQLGTIALERRAFDDAERWNRKALEIKERLGDEHGAANTDHQLGTIALERQAFDDAERWYLKALNVFETLGNELGVARTYYQLGRIDEERRAFDDAERWYRKSLEINERLGNEHGAAGTYHQLGRIDEERGALNDAEIWYHRSLEIKERLCDEGGAAITYHQLGNIALERRAFDDAERWYRKAVEINERQGNEHGAAKTYGQLGIVAGLRSTFVDSARWLARCVASFAATRDEHGAARNVSNFGVFYRLAAPDVRDEMRRIWTAAGLTWSDEFDRPPDQE